MAHTCPNCWQYCTCNGDWDDAEMNLPEKVEACDHCDEEEPPDDDSWEPDPDQVLMPEFGGEG